MKCCTCSQKHEEGAQSSKQGGKIMGHRKFPGSQKFPLLHVSNQSTISKKSIKSSLIISWYVPYKRPNLPAISKMVLCLHSQFMNFQHVFHCDLGRHDLNAHNFRSQFPTAHSWKPFRSLSFYDIVTKTCVEHLFPIQFTRFWKKTYDQCVVPPYQPEDNLISHFTRPMKSSAEI
jgi:hypothetical protein